MRLRSTIRGVNTIVVESKQNRVFCGRCCCCWRRREVNWTMRPRNRRPLPRDACAAWRRRWRHWWRQRWRRCRHRLASAAAAAAASAQHLCTSLVADWQVLSDPQLRHVHSNVGHSPPPDIWSLKTDLASFPALGHGTLTTFNYLFFSISLWIYMYDSNLYKCQISSGFCVPR